jgi:iron complex outermembrane recepter protein
LRKHTKAARPCRRASLQLRPLALACWLAAAGIGSAAWHPAAHAQSASGGTEALIEFDIPAQPLGAALNAIGRQADVQIAADSALLADKTGPAVKGKVTVREALRQVLAGHGLVSVPSGRGFLIQPASKAPAAESVLPVVTVRAGTEALPGELPKPYAGGQVASGVGAGAVGQRVLQDLPFAAQAYTANLVAERQLASPQELQKFNASVNSNFIQGVQGERLQDLSIRGFNASYLIDGVLSPRPLRAQLEAYERIELIKGVASSALSALSGSTLLNVNLVPKRASTTPLSEVTVRSYGGEAFGLAADMGRRFGTDQAWGFRVNAAMDAGETVIKGYKLDRQLLAAALDYQGETLRGSLDMEYSRIAPVGFPAPPIEELGLPIPAFPDTRRTTGQRWTRYDDTVASLIARLEVDLLPQLTLGAVASTGNSRARGASAGIALLQNAQGDTFFDTSFDREDGDFAALQTYLRARFQAAGARHQFSFMLEETRSDFESGRAAVGCADNLYVRQPCPQPEPGPIPRSFAGERQQTGAIAAYELGLWDQRLQVTAGLRRSDLINRLENIAAGTVSDFKGNATTPILAVVVKPATGIALFGNFAESLEFGAVAPNAAVNRGESTAPITGRQLELGAKFDLGSFGAELAWFRIRRDSAYTDPSTGRFGLLGEQQHDGVELSGYGEIAQGWKLIAGATWIDAQYTAARDPAVVGKRVAAVPRFRAVATVEANLGKVFGIGPGLSAYATAAHTGRVAFDLGNTRFLPSFTTLDLGLAYATRLAGRDTTFRLALQNATDKAYWTTNYIGGDLNLSAPRMLFANVSIRF